MLFLICLLLASPWARADYSALVKTYAPRVIQGLGSDPKADEFTAVNFDGDWVGTNNWDNMAEFPHPPAVYFDVIESDRHYFITYAFFYPRDYAPVCFWVHCHENDFEGMRVTVEKPGHVVKLEALAHGTLRTVEFPEEVAVVIEKEGHGIHPLGMRVPDKVFRVYMPDQYKLLPLRQLWNLRHTELFRGEFEYRGKKLVSHFNAKRWYAPVGGAKPPWSWEINGSTRPRGSWFLDPIGDSNEHYLFHPYLGH